MSMSKSPDAAQQIKNIVSVFRALVTSRKQPCTLREILREYPEVESRPIYPNQLGYKSIEELLRESGEFVLTKLGGETCIAAKYSKNSAHIASLVRGQKSSGKSNKVIKKAQTRQPYRPSDQSWNKSSYSSNVYQKLPATLNRFIQSQNAMNGYGDRNNNTNQVNNRNNAQQNHYQQKQQANTSNYNNNNNYRSQQQQQQQQQRPKVVSGGQKDLRDKLNTTNNAQKDQKEQKDLRDKLNTKKDTKMMPSGKPLQQQQQQQSMAGDLRERLNMKQNSQQMQQQQQNAHHNQSQQQFHHQQQVNKDKNIPRAILGQNNNANGGASNYAKQQQQQQQQHQQQQQQQMPAMSAAHLHNSNAIALASTMILAQRQQMVINQHLQQAQKASRQQMQQQQQPPYQQTTQRSSQQQQQQQNQPQKRYQQQQNSASGYQVKQQQQQQHVVTLGPGVPGKNSVQDRLKIKINNNMCNANNNSTGATPDSSPALSSAGSDQPSPFSDRKHNVIKNETHETQQIIPPKVFQFNPKLDPVTSLSQYCVVRRCAQPEYTFFRSKFSKLFQCHVLVNASIYSTYPNEYPNENLAKFSCAAMAIEEIKIQESRRHLPVCPDTDQELATKIFEELKSHPHGIFAKNLPEWFESTFKQLLPDHWWSLIESSKQFLTETSTRDSLIIFANNNFEAGENNEDDEETEIESFALEPIKLPWNEKYWNLYITHCVSTTEIWGRLFGKEYSDEFDNLMNEIEMHMLTDKTRPVSVACKQIYLVCISECWHRVRLEEVDKLNAIGQCFFIDFGDEDWVPVSQLYICEKKFLRMAPQAVAFSLFGLEDFAGNPNAKRHLDSILASKSVVGEILTKEDVYSSSNAEGNAINIQVVLYDTSSQEDVNLNPLVLNQICDDTPPPEIKRNAVTNVLITHITDAGDVFLQVRNSELQYVQKLIHQLIESKFKKDQHKVTRADIQSSSMFLICDQTTNQWYRGVLADNGNSNNNKQSEEDEYDIFYVDYGMTKRTHISNMFQLESLSTALSKFPRQGIKARLDNIPPTTPAIIARMRGLLPVDSRALVKIGTLSTIPLIIVYKRFEGSEALCNVNEVIRIEQELESSSSELLDDSLTLTLNDGKSSSAGSSSNLPSPADTSRNNSSIDLQQAFRNLSTSTKTNSVPNSPQRSDYMLKLKNYEDVPNEGEFMDVRVSMSANPHNFVVQPYKDFPELCKLMKDLQEYCENNDEFIPVDMVEIGQVYAGKNKDDFFHRVIVVNKYQDMIHVSFCDFGDVDILRCDQLKTLPAKFRQLPKQAIQAKLYGIAACNVDWALEDCLRFRELTVGQKFVSIVKKISNGDKISPDTRILELDLIDVQTEKDIFIRKILIDEKRAIEANDTDNGE